MMNKEVPAKIWIPILVACVLLPLAGIGAPRAVGVIILLADIVGGFVGGIWLAFKVRARGLKWMAGCLLGVWFVSIGIAGSIPLTPDPEAAQARLAREAARTQAQQESQERKRAEAAIPCDQLQDGIRDMDRRIALVESAIAADRTLQVDSNLEYKLRLTKDANDRALAEYTRRCQSP